MNASIYSLDRATHFKIVLVAAVMVAAVTLVGKTAQFDRIAASAAPTQTVAQPLLRPTPQPFWRTAPSRTPLTPSARSKMIAPQFA